MITTYRVVRNASLPGNGEPAALPRPRHYAGSSGTTPKVLRAIANNA
jgi:hypothetical protein